MEYYCRWPFNDGPRQIQIGRVIEFLNQDVVKVHPKNMSTRDTISGWESTTLNISYKSCPKNLCKLKRLLPRLWYQGRCGLLKEG